MLSPNFKIKEGKVDNTYGEFVIEPLATGYGHTLGNALRRTLLTSIEGAAVTDVKISGVRHKFSTVPGLRENVVDLLLNIKGLNFRFLDSTTKATVLLSAIGPKKITASDLDLQGKVEVVKKDHYIGALSDKKSKLEMEMTVEKGFGYSLSEERKVATLGIIPTDAVFTPVKRVSYEVSATRVGRQTDLDRLAIKIWTNGVVTPRDALDSAAKILTSYFLQIYEPKILVPEDSLDLKQSLSEGILKLTIDEFDLPTRIYNSLRNGGIETLGQLLKTTKKDLLSLRNMGAKSVGVIENKLKEKNLSLEE